MKSLLNFYRNKIALTITFLSLLSLIPFGFFFNYAKELNELQNNSDLLPGQAAKVLSRTIALPELYVPFIFGVIFWVTNGGLSAYGLAHKQIKTPFAFLALILGGLGIHIIAVLFKMIPWKGFIFKRLKIVASSTLIALNSTVVLAPFMIAMSMNSPEAPFVAPKMKFSLNKDNPNLIEIFTDGFDLKHFDSSDYVNDDNFKEFTWFKNFSTPGHPTHLSLSMILNDFKETNPFKEMYANSANPNRYLDYQYGKAILENGVKHFDYLKNDFNARTLINPVGFSNSEKYGYSLSSTPEAILKKDPTLKVTNWVGARDDNAGSFGFENFPPDVQSYRWFTKNSIISQQGEKGARVYISDMITHRPFMVNDKQEFTVWDIKRDDVAKTLHKSITDVITTLKNLKDSSGFSAYDNSLIMVYGDHASHDFTDFQVDSGDSRPTESSFIVKYPQQSSDTQNKMQIIEDKFIWAPQINGMIQDYFGSSPVTRNDSKWFDNYFNHNQKPNKFANVPRPVFSVPTTYELSSWKQNSNGEWRFTTDKATNPNYKVDFPLDRKSQELEVEKLERMDY